MTNATRILDQLLEVTVVLQQDMSRAFEGTGLTTARTHLLWELYRMGPSTQQALAGVLQVSARNVSGLVDALEGTGYVQRQPHPGDRRAFLVTLTDRGEQAMATMEAEHQELARQLVTGLGPEQAGALEEGLAHVLQRLHGLVAEASAGGPEAGR